MMKPEEIRNCTDLDELEYAYDIAQGYCSEHNSCDPGCKCFIDEHEDCILNLINERFKELELKKENNLVED